MKRVLTTTLAAAATAAGLLFTATPAQAVPTPMYTNACGPAGCSILKSTDNGRSWTVVMVDRLS